MRRSSAVQGVPQTTWIWRRSILPGHQDVWISRVEIAGCASWALTERPQRSRLLLEAYLPSRAAAEAVAKPWGGRIQSINVRKWLAVGSGSLRIGRKLEIVHGPGRGTTKPACPTLHIPHGIAFGSGEHATTYMLLLALARHEDWRNTRVLDLGTGSGVLALAARRLGARVIVATDFDADAVRTAKQNEALNFSTALIRWRRADVRKLRASPRYDLVLANLFSGILEEAAAQIAGCVAPGGQLWLSGILDSQQNDVISAYRAQGLDFRRTVRRGKWIMLLLTKPG